MSETLIFPSKIDFLPVLHYMKDKFTMTPLYAKYIYNPEIIHYRLHAVFFNPDDYKQYRKIVVTVIEDLFIPNPYDSFRFAVSINRKYLTADTIHVVFTRILEEMGNDIRSLSRFDATEERSLKRIQELYVIPVPTHEIDIDDEYRYILDDERSDELRKKWEDDMERYQIKNELFSSKLLPFTTLVHNLKRPANERTLGSSEVFANQELVNIIRQQGFYFGKRMKRDI
jgi:predicted hydrocarbon binding protein